MLPLLHNTRLLRYFYPADIVLIVELVLRGKFAEVPEPLYLETAACRPVRRMERAHRAPAKCLGYPGFRGYPMTRTRIMKGHIEAVLDAPLTSAERRRCLAAVGAALIRDGTTRIILGEIVRATQARIDSGLGRIPLRASKRP